MALKAEHRQRKTWLSWQKALGHFLAASFSFPWALDTGNNGHVDQNSPKYIRRLCAIFCLLLLFCVVLFFYYLWFLRHYCYTDKLTSWIFPKWSMFLQLKRKYFNATLRKWSWIESSFGAIGTEVLILRTAHLWVYCHVIKWQKTSSQPSESAIRNSCSSIHSDTLIRMLAAELPELLCLDVAAMRRRFVRLTRCLRFDSAQSDRLLWSLRATTVMLSGGAWAAVGLGSVVTHGYSHLQWCARLWRCLWLEVISLDFAGCWSGRVPDWNTGWLRPN